MTEQKIGLGRLRHLLGDGYTVEQARRLYRELDSRGLLGGAGDIDPKRIVGLAEVAAMMNRTPQAVRGWRELPEPLVRLKSGPIYDRLHIEGFRAARPELCGVGAENQLDPLAHGAGGIPICGCGAPRRSGHECRVTS